MDYIIRSAKRHQRTLFIALFDLKNAFSEVNHNLIRSSLLYHHLPDNFLQIFNSIYDSFQIAVSCNNSITECISVQKGVLQGDPCSPLLFNICFNSLVKILDSPNYKNFGYSWGNNATDICNWLQYADDAAIVAKDQKSAQGLTNLFDAWCKWAHMEIRLDKCCSFGMCKIKSIQTQILPKLSIHAGEIHAIPVGGHFTYLGRIFDFEMKCTEEKSEILETVEKYLKIITKLKIKPQTKLKIFDRFIPSQISFKLRVCNISVTWISESLDTPCLRYIRQWLETPISSCINEWLITPSKKCGMGIHSFKNRVEQLRLSKRSSMKYSKNENIRNLWDKSKNNNINCDSMLMTHSVNQAKKLLKKSHTCAAENHFLNLPYQGKSAKIITETIPSKLIKEWSKHIERLPGYLFNFVRKAMQSQLPTLGNLTRWGKAASNLCPLCGQIQSNKHVLSNCSNKNVLTRYVDRHNAVLKILATWFKSKLSAEFEIFVDLPNTEFKQTSDLFVSVRPDLVLINQKNVFVFELTVCHETNVIASRDSKIKKYENLDKLKSEFIKDHKLLLSTCELTVLGFLSFESEILDYLKLSTDSVLRYELTKTVVSSSFNIYVNRNCNSD